MQEETLRLAKTNDFFIGLAALSGYAAPRLRTGTYDNVSTITFRMIRLIKGVFNYNCLFNIFALKVQQ